MSEGVSDQALESQTKSEEKYALAETKVLEVEENLRPQLIEAQNHVGSVRDMNLYVSDTVADVDKYVNTSFC